ncbi:MAG: LolA family protein [Candidatus Pelagibacter sp.]
MKKCLIIFFILSFNLNAHGSSNQKIINHLKNINSFKFKFIQKIDNNNIEKGECIVLYPKKIFCEYHDIYNKILVSNGKSLVINSDKIKSYYRYPIDKTPLNFILDKKFLIEKIDEGEDDKNYPFYYVLKFEYENNLIKVFFDKKSLDLIGWETKDIYHNLIQTFLSDININVDVEEKIFSIQRYTN